MKIAVSLRGDYGAMILASATKEDACSQGNRVVGESKLCIATQRDVSFVKLWLVRRSVGSYVPSAKLRFSQLLSVPER